MSGNPAKCPVCGSPKSSRLDDNCPTCLLRLGTPATPAAEASDTPRTASGEVLCRLGDYELLGEIARGGMGCVYRARQISLNRIVAVKLLLGGQFANETFIKRFRREAEAAASLNHSNIVSIYEVGEHEGLPWFSMELIEGRNLADLTRDSPMPARRAAQLVETIAEAVHFAHQRRLLHRDLKPSNVLVDTEGAPHITDFGLAKHIEGDADLTLTGQMVGTPNYMPPEQADPARGAASPASDVYSIGAILYQLLTGRPPFMAETITQTLRQVIESSPVTPRLLNPALSRDLETICAKCLEKDPKRRYASARDLADELGRFLRGEPSLARPVGAPARLARWCRRKPALALSLGAATTLLLVVAIGSPIALIRISRDRNRAEAAERETEQQLYYALLEQARATLKSGELGHRVRVLDAVRRAGVISNSPALRGIVAAAYALPDLRFERELPFAKSEFTLRQVDPSFKRIAVCRSNGPVEIRATSDLRLLATLPASTNLPVYNAEWSPDGRFLAVKRDYPPNGARTDREVWDLAASRRLLLLQDAPFNSISYHPRLPRLLVGQTDGVGLWDLEACAELGRIPLDGTPYWVRFSPDGERFAASYTVNGNWMVSIHQLATGELVSSNSFDAQVPSLNWHPSGRWIAVPDHHGGVHSLDAKTGEKLLLGRHRAEAVRTEFTPDGDYLFSGGWAGGLICWDARTLRRALDIGLNGHRGPFRSDGLAYALETATSVQLYTFERSRGFREFAEDLGVRLVSAEFSPDGRRLAAAGAERMGIWDLQSGGPGALVNDAGRTRVSFAANGELFAHVAGSGFRWRVSPGANPASAPELLPLELALPVGFASLATVSNGVVFTGARGSALVDSDELGTLSQEWRRTGTGINGVSPDGRWLALFPTYSPYLVVHRFPNLERVAVLTNKSDIRRFRFTPASDEVAISCQFGVEFWNTATWQRTRVITNFDCYQSYLPDGKTMWLTEGYRAAGLYDSRTLELLMPLPVSAYPLATSADGRWLAVSMDLRRLQVWDLEELRSQLRALGVDWTQR